MKRNALILIGLIILVLAFVLYRSRIKTASVREAASQNEKLVAHTKPMTTERVELKTQDDAVIVGDFYDTGNLADTGIVSLHMMPATRESFSILAIKLQKAGYPGVAIDLRGHGESEGGPDGYKAFKDEDHQQSIEDVRAVAEFLKTKGVKTIYLIGASIGANLALEYLAESSEAKAAVLLSPGLDYRGIKTKPLIKKVSSGKAVYLVAADDDAYSAESIRKLFDEVPAGVARTMTVYKSGGHGTTLFQTQPELIGEIEKWVQSLKK
ncbi:MAG: alpha/beta fold hydrolase [Candidatus Sungbacteria bacterium]|nr:alpha/beta fold hydrolase [Candidatus Sungbacteria bacterium]